MKNLVSFLNESSYTHNDIKNAKQMAVILDPTQEPRVLLFNDYSEAENLFSDWGKDGEIILNAFEALGPNEQLIRVDLKGNLTVIICDIEK